MIENKLLFRNAEITDIKEMQELYVNTIKNVCQKDYDEAQIEAWISGVSNTERWMDVIANQFVLLATIEDKIVGYGTLKNNNYIDLFYVHKNFQKQGIAEKIMMHLESRAKQNHSQIITSDVSKTARSFFEKKGFLVKLEQQNFIKGVELINYKMMKEI